ncbi:hypothetical protein [Usitatibacter palustris]|uniref:Uncharacterized protein n=1 Tax=Usitatibacter palustris TaxID=2732487 RepID=A0A6M4H264_9PROT|nr:hypothetical protein [Usitatibacter palustris]QJR13560.1 hypothetical protein DSM104440_00344 [Usitatibacter palustris]
MKERLIAVVIGAATLAIIVLAVLGLATGTLDTLFPGRRNLASSSNGIDKAHSALRVLVIAAAVSIVVVTGAFMLL